jgi:DNA (cytosine-5)-methyltransferase 1
MKRPRALDLFCGAGGAAMGLHRAGFDVVGIDNRPQPRYPFPFIQADALKPPVRLEDFDLVWASPPCQAHSAMRTMPNAKDHPDLIPPTRAMLEASGKAWVIENVPGAPLRSPLKLCGTMFGLGTKDGTAELRRHRLFETSFDALLAPPCNHSAMMVCGVYGGHGRDHRRTIGNYGDGAGTNISNARKRKRSVGVYGHAVGSSVRDGTQQFSTQQRREAMGIDWMTGNELSQAIPPAYSEHIGRYALLALGVKGEA